MLGFVKIAVGHVRIVFEACDAEEIVTVCRFPRVDEIGQLVAVILPPSGGGSSTT